MLYIRADGNAEIGTGHIMRCLSIAAAVRQRKQKVVFLTADHEMQTVIENAGYTVVCLESTWNDLNREIEKLQALMAAQVQAVLLVDSYFVTEQYLTKLCQVVKVCYIDDLNEINYPCDMLINYNCYAANIQYEQRYKRTELLLGASFVPLRREFQKLPVPEIQNPVRSILITTGGTDNYQIALRLLQRWPREKYAHVQIHAVAGRFNKKLEELRMLERTNDNIHVYADVKNMKDLMISCDVAVSAGGSTLYELCACGTPTVVVTLADNQREAAKTFSENGIMIYAGDIRDDKSCISNIVEAIQLLYAKGDIRREMSEKMQNLVDGYGAARIADKIIQMMRS